MYVHIQRYMWIYTPSTHPSTHPPVTFSFLLCTVVFTWLEAHSKAVLSNKVIERHVFDKCCIYTFLLNAHLNPKCA